MSLVSYLECIEYNTLVFKNSLGVTVPYQSFGDTIPVPTVARVHFLSSKFWYEILTASVAMLFC
jgi:hypothetical protein